MKLAKQNGTVHVTGRGRAECVILDFDDEGLQFDLDVATSICWCGKQKGTGKAIARMVKERIKFYGVRPAVCTLLSGQFGQLNGETFIHNAKILLS